MGGGKSYLGHVGLQYECSLVRSLILIDFFSFCLLTPTTTCIKRVLPADMFALCACGFSSQ